MYASIFDVDVHKMRKELSEENFFLEKSMDWSKGRGQKKKNLEFSRFSQTHPPTPYIGQNLEKKYKFYCPKMIF